MQCTPAEIEQIERFETVYERALTPAMQAIERTVCGCDYGGNSWLTRQQADHLGSCLDLKTGKHLLDLGAGSGWPAVYLAKTFGCAAMLVDLPENSLQFAEKRAVIDGVANRVDTLVADAADLPLAPESFDAISHCDLLCCLVRKRAVLENCRRTIRPRGRMAFTVISIAPGLSNADYRQAIGASPEFVDSEADYQTLLHQTGWSNTEYFDITTEYEASCRRQIEADRKAEDQLVALIGRDEFVARMTRWRKKLTAIQNGIIIRELFVATPDSRQASWA